MEARLHIIVEGMVQGVGFRWFVAQRAVELGLRGFVKNLNNGNVEIEAVGHRALVEELIKQVKVGPRSAHVKNLRLEWLEHSAQEYAKFEIR
jgi:acylphosphatase